MESLLMFMEESRSDVELMQAIAQGEQNAFLSLMKRHEGAVYGTIVKMLGDRVEAEDLAQQIFLRVYQAARTYRPEAQFRTWLYTIVRHTVFNEYRRRKRASFFPLHSFFTLREEEKKSEKEWIDLRMKSPIQEILDQEKLYVVDQAILALPRLQRLAVILRRYHELPYEEIASILKTTIPAVKSLLFRAREFLRDQLHDYLQDDSCSFSSRKKKGKKTLEGKSTKGS